MLNSQGDLYVTVKDDIQSIYHFDLQEVSEWTVGGSWVEILLKNGAHRLYPTVNVIEVSLNPKKEGN